MLADKGKALMAGRSYASADIKHAMDTLGILWTRLKQFANARKQALDTALLAEQYRIDANEAESWLGEREQVCVKLKGGVLDLKEMALLRNHTHTHTHTHARK